MAAGGEHEDVPPVPLSRCICLTHNVVSSPGEGRERTPRFYSTPLSASGVGCRERRSLKLEGFGAGANGSEARAPKPFLACEGCDPVTSGRAPRRRTFLHFEELRPIPVGRNSVLGIAKLLPLIGPVKRETPYVVSSAMTALIRGKGQVFHTTFTSGLAEWRRVGREPAAEICGERSVRVDRCGGGEGNWVGRAGLG
jgi:hypothetical protein